MNRYPTGFFLPLLASLLCLTFLSCGEDSSSPLSEEDHETAIPKIFFVFPYNGPGDNGYLDKILHAAAEYTIVHPGEACIILPQDSLEAAGTYKNICELTSMAADRDTVLSIFVGLEYKESLYNAPPPKSNHEVLLLEDDGAGAPYWLHTCRIKRYGVSYLAGAMVAQQAASIIAALPGDPTLEESIAGFCKGYASVKGREVDSIYYLSSSYDGFNMQEKARELYKKLYWTDWTFHTLFPLAGSSNQGIYNEMTDYGNYQAIGMDKDWSFANKCIPFSIDIGIDRLLLDCLEKWETDGELPEQRAEGLGSQFIKIIFNEQWNTNKNFNRWENEDHTSIESPDEPPTYEFWEQRYALFLDQAIKEEKAYEKH